MSSNTEATTSNLTNGTGTKPDTSGGSNQQNLAVDQKHETMIAKIQRKKQVMCSWPMQKKLLKLAVYLKCQVR